MLQSEKMAFANIFVYSKDKDKIVNGIIKSKVFHLVDSDKINTFLDKQQGIYKNLEKTDLNKLKSKILETINLFNFNTDEWKLDDIEDQKLESFNYAEEIEQLDKINFDIESIFNKLKNIDNEIIKYQEMIEQIEILQKGGNKLINTPHRQFLEFKIGSINKDIYENAMSELKSYPSVGFPIKIKENKMIFYLIYVKKFDSNIMEILNKYGYADIDLSIDIQETNEKEILPNLLNKIKELTAEKNKLLKTMDDKKKKHIDHIKEIYYKFKLLETKEKVNKYFLHTENIYIISGWFPYKFRKKIINILNTTVGEKNYYLEIYKASELKTRDIPVFFENPKILKPFEDLTYNYGTPQYRTINPVPFVALTYLIMFGVMFGDLGHGFILFLTGLIFKIVKKLRTSSFSSVANLIFYCGIAAMIFGVLFGSVFGYEDILKPVWLRPMENLNTLFGLAIGFGIVIITIGILINIINAIITKDYLEGFFSKSGLLGGIFYWGFLIVISKIFVLKETPHKIIIWTMILIPLIILFLKEPITYFAKKRKKLFKDGFAIYLMEYIVNLLELVIGYISNTMSFIRIIAFGLAHTGLFIAIFSIVKILQNANAPGFVSWITIILGNIGIILLEGLVVSIQAMRLEYYEFFGKFFEKTGKKYKPIKLN